MKQFHGFLVGAILAATVTAAHSPPTLAKDLSVQFVCAADDSPKVCTNVVFTNQPWHVIFDVINLGPTTAPAWSFDILLRDPTGVVFPVKQQVNAPPLAPGQPRRFNWAMPFFSTTQKGGPWTVIVRVQNKCTTCPPDPPSNNQGAATFEVRNKPLVSDIGIDGACVTLDDPNKTCRTSVFTQQRWHILFKVINKGEKPVDDWSFDIFLNGPTGSLLLKSQVPGPPLPVGGSTTINWPSPHIFDPTQKGPWQVVVVVKVKDPTNPEPPELEGNNRSIVQFTVENKPPVSDIGVSNVCVTLSEPTKSCTDTIFVKLDWHILFRVLNKGQKPVDNWSFDIFLQRPGGTIPLKNQISGPPLGVDQSITINWPSPHRFIREEKGPWEVVVVVTVKDPTNPEPPELQGNNRATDLFTVVNHPLADVGDPLPTELRLRNAPNPFAASTNILFDLPRENHAELGVYDFSGRLVKRLLLSGSLPAGSHTVIWDGVDDSGRLAPAGVYLYRLRVGGLKLTRRMVLMK